ncbi:MAG: hypothetical protein EOO41_02315, partial [Methanobacteriota archaeon]
MVEQREAFKSSLEDVRAPAARNVDVPAGAGFDATLIDDINAFFATHGDAPASGYGTQPAESAGAAARSGADARGSTLVSPALHQ